MGGPSGRVRREYRNEGCEAPTERLALLEKDLETFKHWAARATPYPPTSASTGYGGSASLRTSFPKALRFSRPGVIAEAEPTREAFSSVYIHRP